MDDFAYATSCNIRRLRNLLDTSVDETERRTLERLLIEEKNRASSHASGRDEGRAIGRR